MAERTGWMVKEGGRYKSWKKRYFVLSGPVLFYFKEEEAAWGDTAPVATGRIYLPPYTVVQIVDGYKKTKNCFSLSVSKTQRTFYFDAPSPSERKAWMEAVMSNAKYTQEMYCQSFESTVFFVGSPGSGKTSLVRRIAAHSFPSSDQLVAENGKGPRVNYTRRIGLYDKSTIRTTFVDIHASQQETLQMLLSGSCTHISTLPQELLQRARARAMSTRFGTVPPLFPPPATSIAASSPSTTANMTNHSSQDSMTSGCMTPSSSANSDWSTTTFSNPLAPQEGSVGNGDSPLRADAAPGGPDRDAEPQSQAQSLPLASLSSRMLPPAFKACVFVVCLDITDLTSYRAAQELVKCLATNRLCGALFVVGTKIDRKAERSVNSALVHLWLESDFCGRVPYVEISAKTGNGMEEFLSSLMDHVVRNGASLPVVRDDLPGSGKDDDED